MSNKKRLESFLMFNTVCTHKAREGLLNMGQRNDSPAKIVGTLNNELLVTNGILAWGVDSTGSKDLVMGRDGVFYCQCASWVYRKGTKPHLGLDRTCKHMRPFMDQKGVPVLATAEKVTAYRTVNPEVAPEEPKVEAPKVEAPVAKAKRGRPARTQVQNERLAELLKGGQSKNEAKITLEGLKILGL